MTYPAPITRLIDAFKALPGVGSRTAERFTFHLLRERPDDVRALADAVVGLIESVVACGQCHNISESDPCPICSDPGRDRARVLVVEQPRDVAAFEQAGWKGLYHVLLGHINPVEGVDAGDLTIASLLKRAEAEGFSEIVLGTNPDYEGDTTALHLRERLGDDAVRVSRIARGVASGQALEYSNASTLADALAGRAPMDAG